MTEAEKAKNLFDAALVKAHAATINDAKINGLLRDIKIEPRKIFLFAEYGSPGFEISVPDPQIKPWKIAVVQLLMMNEDTLCKSLIIWATSGKVTTPTVF